MASPFQSKLFGVADLDGLLSTLSVFHFVNEHPTIGETLKWAELNRLWEEQHPDDKFEDRSAFRKVYQRQRTVSISVDKRDQ